MPTSPPGDSADPVTSTASSLPATLLSLAAQPLSWEREGGDGAVKWPGKGSSLCRFTQANLTAVAETAQLRARRCLLCINFKLSVSTTKLSPSVLETSSMTRSLGQIRLCCQSGTQVRAKAETSSEKWWGVRSQIQLKS